MVEVREDPFDPSDPLPTALRLLDALEVVEVEEELRLGHLPEQEEEGGDGNGV